MALPDRHPQDWPAAQRSLRALDREGTEITRNLKVTRDALLNVRDQRFGATGDGITDDTEAIQAAIDAAEAAAASRPVRVILPGHHLVSQQGSVGGIPWALHIGSSNVHLWFAPGAKIRCEDDCNLLFMFPGEPADWLLNDIWRDSTDGISPTSTLVLRDIDPASRGDYSVTTSTAADAGNFSAGDWVYIRTGQTINNAQNRNSEPDAEINRVVSATAGTGVIVLERPLAKDYAQEWQSAVGQESTTTVDSVATPLAIVNITGRVMENIGIHNGHFVGEGSAQATLRLRNVVGYTEVDTHVDSVSHARAMIQYRDGEFRNISAHMSGPGTASVGLWPWTVGTGCTDVEVDGVRAWTPDALPQLHVHEGPGRVEVRRARMYGNGDTATYPVIDVRGRAYDVEFEDYLISGNGDGAAIFVDSDCSGGGRIGRGVIRGSWGADPTIIQATGWDAEPHSGAGKIITYSSLASRAPLVPTKAWRLVGWVSDDDLTVELGSLPKDAYVEGTEIHVTEAFNSDGSDNIRVGWSASKQALATNTDVSTTGVKIPTAGTSVGYQATTQTIEASYLAGGSAPTTGKALVIVKLSLATRTVS